MAEPPGWRPLVSVDDVLWMIDDLVSADDPTYDDELIVLCAVLDELEGR